MEVLLIRVAGVEWLAELGIITIGMINHGAQ